MMMLMIRKMFGEIEKDEERLCNKTEATCHVVTLIMEISWCLVFMLVMMLDEGGRKSTRRQFGVHSRTNAWQDWQENLETFPTQRKEFLNCKVQNDKQSASSGNCLNFFKFLCLECSSSWLIVFPTKVENLSGKFSTRAEQEWPSKHFPIEIDVRTKKLTFHFQKHLELRKQHRTLSNEP